MFSKVTYLETVVLSFSLRPAKQNTYLPYLLRYCASPFSGMGTTLALTGAYNLAGALLQHPDDLATAFTAYEEKMKPTVARAQRLAPGMPKLFHPETAWGVWALNMFVYLLDVSGLAALMFKLGAGPPANNVPVEEYGIGDLPEMLEG